MVATRYSLAIASVFMALYVCQFSALDWQLDPEEARLAQELRAANFEEIDFLGDDDSNEVQARAFSDVMTKLKEKCKCIGNNCGCCAEPKIFGIKISSCLNMTMYPNEKILQFGVGLSDQAFKKNVSVGALQKMCSNFPGYLSKVQMCMYTTWDETPEFGMTSCTSIDTNVFNTTVASLNFHCLQWKDNKLDFSPAQDAGRKAVMKLKIKNPIKGVINFFKKKKEEEQKKA